ncbi:hypothetical protein EG327_009326 [Venturia inaequalis]|uniref:Fungal N-terminal domain-containing protein n=1 Tax=Venturia inaequalis TaxID=5025 RepID=A0A8H3YV10_VENIN|nr:hypothetical protein EG327_009326 [Venturia inaequalis]
MSGMEALGAVSSIIAIADAGLKLYNYIESVASADKRLKTVAANLKITCDVVKHVGCIFEKEETAKLVGSGAIETAKVATKECQGVFDELRLAISKSERNRYLFPLREAKLELLAVQLEKLKSSLVLLMSVLNQATSLFHRKSGEEREKIRELIQSNDEATTKYKELKRSYDLLLSRVAPNPIASSVHFLLNKFSAVEATPPPPYDEQPAFGTRALDTSVAKEPSIITKETLENCSKQVSELLFSIQLITRSMGDVGAATLAHRNAHAQYKEVRASLDALFLGTTSNSNGQSSTLSAFPVTVADQARFDSQRSEEGESRGRQGYRSATGPPCFRRPQAVMAAVTAASYEPVVVMADSSKFEVDRRAEWMRQGNGSASLHALPRPLPLPLQQPQLILPQQDEDWAPTTESKKGKKGKKRSLYATETPPEMIPLPGEGDDGDLLVEPQPGSEKLPTHDVEDEPPKKSNKDQKIKKQNLSWEIPRHDDGEEKMSADILGVGATAAALSARQAARLTPSTPLKASGDHTRYARTAAVSDGCEIDGGWESAPTSDIDDDLTYGDDSDIDRKIRRKGFTRSSCISTLGGDRRDEVDDLLHQWTTLYDDKNDNVEENEGQTRLSFASWFF